MMKQILLTIGLAVCSGLIFCSGSTGFADGTTLSKQPQKAIRARTIRAASAPKNAPASAPLKPLSSSTSPGYSDEVPAMTATPRTNVHPAAVELSAVPAAGQKKWEAILAEPADLDFDGRKAVTVKELIDGLRERHELSLRIDIPTFSALVGVEHLATKSKEIKQAKGNLPAYTAKAERALSVHLAGGARSQESSPIVESNPDASPKSTADESAADESTANAESDDENSDDDGDAECDDDESEGKADIADGDGEDDEDSEINIIDKFLTLEVNVQTLDLRNAMVSTVLRQALDAMPITLGTDFAEMPFPISLSNACLLDYLVEKDGLVITTRMQALSHKETRVYSLKNLKDINPEQLAKIVRQSIRPWSWRSQINDLGDQLRGLQLPGEMVKSIVTSGVQLASAQTGATVTISDGESANGKPKNEASDTEQLNAIGNATVNGLVTFAHATVLGLEMAHHADFPTGTILTLPGKLIVTQSQAAHREIAELLKQLADE